jgi:hypothetical protein
VQTRPGTVPALPFAPLVRRGGGTTHHLRSRRGRGGHFSAGERELRGDPQVGGALPQSLAEDLRLLGIEREWRPLSAGLACAPCSVPPQASAPCRSRSRITRIPRLSGAIAFASPTRRNGRALRGPIGWPDRAQQVDRRPSCAASRPRPGRTAWSLCPARAERRSRPRRRQDRRAPHGAARQRGATNRRAGRRQRGSGDHATPEASLPGWSLRPSLTSL